MGQTQNRTFKAPDGSTYRVEDDGSVTKIAHGRVQSNEPPSRYQITPEGKIYRMEDDGSVTYLGDAEERSVYGPGHRPRPRVQQKKSNSWLWITGAFLLLALVSISLLIHDSFNSSGSVAQETWEADPKFQETNELPDDMAGKVESITQSATSTTPEQGRTYFTETASFYGGNAEEESTSLTFYPDGSCYIYEDVIGESRECWGNYYFQGSAIYVTWGDGLTENFILSGDSFTRYGMTISRTY